MTALPVIPNIDVGQQIGAGSFGQVYRGRHRTLDVDVAVKVVGAGVLSDVDGVLKEARFMARLDHPNLLRIFDAGRRFCGRRSQPSQRRPRSSSPSSRIRIRRTGRRALRMCAPGWTEF